MSTMSTEQTYTTEEAAEKLRRTPGRIRQICQTKEVGRKYGRDWILSDADLRLIAEWYPPEKNCRKTA